MYLFIFVFTCVILALTSIFLCLAVVAQFRTETRSPSRRLALSDYRAPGASRLFAFLTRAQADRRHAWWVIIFTTLIIFAVTTVAAASYVPVV